MLAKCKSIRVENIFERLVEKKEDLKYKNLTEYKARVKGYGEMKYPFIEYLSYRLNKQGRSSYSIFEYIGRTSKQNGNYYRRGSKERTLRYCCKKSLSMANCITSMKELLRIDFLSIFEEDKWSRRNTKTRPCKGLYKNGLQNKGIL